MSTDKSNKDNKYMHTNYEEMMAHVTKWKSKAKQHVRETSCLIFRMQSHAGQLVSY